METKQPWENNFPIKQSEEHRVSRRQFAVFCGCSAVALGAGFPVREALLKIPKATEPIVVAEEGELPRNGSKLFHYPTPHHPCILIRLKDERYVAYSQSCTHLMCPVHFDAVNGKIVCPCHHGYFDPEDGSVLAGPPQGPLPRYKVSVTEGQVLVGPEWDEEELIASEIA